MKYKDPTEFWIALDQELKERAKLAGHMQDYIKLKEELAIERFMARMDPQVAIVKGGAAAMFTLSNTPHTKDVDLIITDKLVHSLGLDSMEPTCRADALADLVQEHLQATKNDFLRFKLEDAFPITDLKSGHACARINITVMVNRAELHLLQVDIALQDRDVPTEMRPGRDMLGFAGIENPYIRTVTPEYLLADKVCLYLEEHGKPDADRVKDIVHAALLIECCSLNAEKVAQSFAASAVHRDVLDKLNRQVPPPPDYWEDRFNELVEEAKSDMSMQEAIDMIRKVVTYVRKRVLEIVKEQGPAQ